MKPGMLSTRGALMVVEAQRSLQRLVLLRRSGVLGGGKGQMKHGGYSNTSQLPARSALERGMKGRAGEEGRAGNRVRWPANEGAMC